MIGCLGWTNNQISSFSRVPDPICLSKMQFEGNKLYGKTISKIEASGHSSAVIDTEGKIYTFGDNNYGQLGNGTSESSGQVNEQICLNDTFGELYNVKFVDVSIANFLGEHMLALDSEGNIWTWGENDEGQCGTSKNYGSNIVNPYCISKEEGNSLYGIKIKQIYAGYEHSLAIDEENNIWTWGNNNAKQLGYVTKENTTYIAKCLTKDSSNKLYNKVITNIAGGTNMSLAIDEEGCIYTWGNNYKGQLGQLSEYRLGDIMCINDDISLKTDKVSLGYNYCLALDKSGELWSWGSSEYGKSGRTEDVAQPLKLEGTTYGEGSWTKHFTLLKDAKYAN